MNQLYRPDTQGHRIGFWVTAGAFLVSMAFSTIPTPLYTMYQAVDGFPTWIITVIFGAYAVGVMASLYFAGHVSDWLGRRPVMLVSIALEILSDLVFLGWPSTFGLVVARLLNGLGVGLLTATATAHLAELRSVSHPGRATSLPSLVATAVNMGGLALGPLVSGALAQFVDRPLVVPYVVFLVLLIVSGALVATVPETVLRPSKLPAYRPQKLVVVQADRGAFFAASAGAFAAFAILGMFTSLSPVFLAKNLHETSRLVAGIVTFAVFGAGTLAQVVLSGLKLRTQLLIGLGAIATGLVAVTGAVLVVSEPIFLVGGVLAGVGLGLMFRTSIQMAAQVAPPAIRGGVMALVFLVAFAGLTVPVLGLGIALQFVSSQVALTVFASLILVVSLWSGSKLFQRLGAA